MGGEQRGEGMDLEWSGFAGLLEVVILGDDLLP